MNVASTVALFLLLFGVPFLGALAGGYVAGRARRGIHAEAKNVGEVMVVRIDVDTDDAEQAVERLRDAIEGVAERMAHVDKLAVKTGADVEQ